MGISTFQNVHYFTGMVVYGVILRSRQSTKQTDGCPGKRSSFRCIYCSCGLLWTYQRKCSFFTVVNIGLVVLSVPLLAPVCWYKRCGSSPTCVLWTRGSQSWGRDPTWGCGTLTLGSQNCFGSLKIFYTPKYNPTEWIKYNLKMIANSKGLNKG